MRISVQLYGDLRRGSCSERLELDVSKGATVADVIESLGLKPGEVWLVKLDNRLLDMNYRLRPGDALSLIPPIGGG